MSKPTTKAIRTRLEQQGVPAKRSGKWAAFLSGLDWKVINPLITMSTKTGVHPAFAAAMTARSTRDEQMRSLLEGHIESKAASSGDHGSTPGTTPSDTPTQ